MKKYDKMESGLVAGLLLNVPCDLENALDVLGTTGQPALRINFN